MSGSTTSTGAGYCHWTQKGSIKRMTNNAIIAVYFNVSIQSEWSIVNICLLVECATWKEALRTVSWFKCRVVCVCVCGNAKYQKMDKCCLAYFKSFLYIILLTQHLLRKCQTASFKTTGNSCVAGQDSFVSRLSSERASAWKIQCWYHSWVGRSSLKLQSPKKYPIWYFCYCKWTSSSSSWISRELL